MVYFFIFTSFCNALLYCFIWELLIVFNCFCIKQKCMIYFFIFTSLLITTFSVVAGAVNFSSFFYGVKCYIGVII